MPASQPKKLLIINILDILRKYTDEDHRLSQKEIIDILKDEYGMNVDRKSIRRNISDLIDFGYEINFNESVRKMPGKDGKSEESVVLSDFCLVRDFTDSELRLLIDSVLFSKNIPSRQCRMLIEKLEGLSNTYFRSRVAHIRTMPESSGQNKQLFYTIEVLDEAISKNNQISFCYNRYGTDKKLSPETDTDGRTKRFIVNPYQIAAANGRYYLICNYDNYDNVVNIRLDRITEIKLLESPAKPTSKVRGLENGLDLPRHMAEHIYMYSGESANVTFRADKKVLNDVFDWFGTDIAFSNETEKTVDVTTRVNLTAMRRWSVQYAPYITVLSPAALKDEVVADLETGLAHYGK